jgi:hypothetical protein
LSGADFKTSLPHSDQTALQMCFCTARAMSRALTRSVKSMWIFSSVEMTKTARKQRDMLVNELFASKGIPLLRIHVREVNQVEKLIHTLTQAWYHRWTTLAHHQAAIA